MKALHKRFEGPLGKADYRNSFPSDSGALKDGRKLITTGNPLIGISTGSDSDRVSTIRVSGWVKEER